MPKREDKIELHAHTNASDGYFAPGQLVRFAAQCGLKALAITDHDTTAALGEARAEGAKLQVEIIPGVELSALQGSQEIHFLGYYIDEDNRTFQHRLKSFVDDRYARAQSMLKKLKALGYPISMAEVEAQAGPQGALGRPHIALVLMERRFVKSVSEAFDRLLNPGCPAFVPRRKLSATEAIKLIVAAQGIPVLAHPGLGFPLFLLEECLRAGLVGIECYHPIHTRWQTAKYLEIARQNQLVVTGGSDFHGYEQTDWKNFGRITPSNALRDLQKVRQGLHRN